ncbi:ASCH domain-containing protein [Wielerella bovis]|uniref:ASCH domain-containing protein n=1 Tax=Wielerella bovis TaxID=2917790 RepID=UPI0020194502|nr:ASCH domain-containing protein [Wielerella bovis]ULJ64027.1 ASCH domain-containing protein [Wielerella bovis]ULJ67511.1 ASCH domain-containing protein [Wielerella bovis]
MRILLSIKPEFVEKIISGEKKFEFRRKLPKKTGIHTVIVYATLPVGKVVGEFSVQQILSMPPDELWHQTATQAGINKGFFDDYFNETETAHAFQIGIFKQYKQPKLLSDFIPSGCAPQSFCYV